MSWVRIDDGLAEHPKFARLGPLGIALQIRALCYAARHLTDGFIPYSVVPLLTGDFPKGPLRRGSPFVDEMVAIGVWEDHRDRESYRIHDYLDYNPSAAEVRTERQRKSEAGKKGGTNRAATASRSAGGVFAPAAHQTEHQTGCLAGASGTSASKDQPPFPFPKDQDLKLTPSQSKLEGEVSKFRPKKTDPEVAWVIRTWHESFTAKHGSPPPVNGGKAGSIAKKLLSGRSADEAVWLVKEFFRAPPDWYADRNLFGIEHVLAAAPTLLARRAKEPREY